MLKKEKRRQYVKSVFLFLSLGGSLLLLSGCWDRIEINDLAIVTAAAIDKKGDNRIELSLQVVIPRALGGGQQGQGGGGGEKATVVASGEGINIAEALSKLQADFPRHIFWGHCKVFIFGEELAKEGITEQLDFLLRHPEPRERGFVFISDGKAKELLALQTTLERDSSETIREVTKQNNGLQMTLQDLQESLMGEAQAAALPCFKIVTAKPGQGESYQFPKTTGIAILKKGRMTGKLSEKKMRGVLWLRNEIKGYTAIARPRGTEGEIALNPVTAHVNLVPRIQNGKWQMDVKIRTEGSVVQNSTSLDLTNPEAIKTAEEAYKKAIQQRVKLTVKDLQRNVKADIADFGKEFHRKYPQEWNEAKNRWDELFPEVKVNVSVEAHIRRQGTINEPVETEVGGVNKR